jgi:MFS family permease
MAEDAAGEHAARLVVVGPGNAERMNAQAGVIETDIPARLDRLPWARFHWMVVLGLGTVWILDGLEVTIVGSIASRLTEKGSGISLNAADIGTAAAIYVAGACVGALFFGQLTDRFGRKKLFLITLAVYIAATVATAFAWTPWYFYVCRFLTGAGIGGEYSAINSAIDELIPARVRGRVDLIINGSYWVGAAAGSAAALLLLDESLLPKDIGWRLAFGLGAVLGLAIMFVRRHVPESPRWLFIHGREEEAEEIVRSIEQQVEGETGDQLDAVDQKIKVRQRKVIPFRTIAETAFKLYPKRAVLGIALFVGQAFLYNGVTFNLGDLFSKFYGVSSSYVPVFIIVFAVGNFLGPLLLGRLFDTVGRIPMIAGTYLGSAACAAVLAILFDAKVLDSPWSFEALIFVTFFLASAGASAAYLTVSEIFPMETRALAIAFFYAVGTGLGGIIGPLLFGQLIESNDRSLVMVAFLIGAGVMALGGIAEIFLGVRAEQTALEDIAKPLTAEEAESGALPGQDGEEDEQQRRWRERDEATSARERAGRRRYRPGPGAGETYYSPGMIGTAGATRRAHPSVLDREVESVARALQEHGPMRREELARRVGARRWGPGRFQRALGEAVAEGRARRTSRGMYAPPDQ